MHNRYQQLERIYFQQGINLSIYSNQSTCEAYLWEMITQINKQLPKSFSQLDCGPPECQKLLYKYYMLSIEYAKCTDCHQSFLSQNLYKQDLLKGITQKTPYILRSFCVFHHSASTLIYQEFQKTQNRLRNQNKALLSIKNNDFVEQKSKYIQKSCFFDTISDTNSTFRHLRKIRDFHNLYCCFHSKMIRLSTQLLRFTFMSVIASVIYSLQYDNIMTNDQFKKIMQNSQNIQKKQKMQSYIAKSKNMVKNKQQLEQINKQLSKIIHQLKQNLNHQLFIQKIKIFSNTNNIIHQYQKQSIQIYLKLRAQLFSIIQKEEQKIKVCCKRYITSEFTSQKNKIQNLQFFKEMILIPSIQKMASCLETFQWLTTNFMEFQQEIQKIATLSKQIFNKQQFRFFILKQQSQSSDIFGISNDIADDKNDNSEANFSENSKKIKKTSSIETLFAQMSLQSQRIWKKIKDCPSEMIKDKILQYKLIAYQLDDYFYTFSHTQKIIQTQKKLEK